MSEATVLIQSIETKPTANGGTLYLVKDGNGTVYKTFKPEVGSEAQRLQGKQSDIGFTEKTTEKNGRSFTDKFLDTITEHEEKRADGDTDWDLIGLRKTRCALWGAYLAGGLSSEIARHVPEGKDKGDAIVRVGKRLVVAAEQDIFGRPEGEDGIPFLWVDAYSAEPTQRVIV